MRGNRASDSVAVPLRAQEPFAVLGVLGEGDGEEFPDSAIVWTRRRYSSMRTVRAHVAKGARRAEAKKRRR